MKWLSLWKLSKDKKAHKYPVYLKKKYELRNNETIDGVGVVVFDIYDLENHKVGAIDLRLVMNEMMFYYGHIGYHIIEKYQGNHYAYYACLEILNIAKNTYHMDEIIITCNKDNYPSIKTIKKLKPKLLGLYDVPINHELYRIGEKQKLIYSIKL